jgi:hypothetical protein
MLVRNDCELQIAMISKGHAIYHIGDEHRAVAQARSW